MPDPGRIVEVVGGACRGSGYLIARGLVLTAWHVARPSETQPGRQLGVRLLRDTVRRRSAGLAGPAPTYAATILWPLADPGAALDFALLHADAPSEPGDGPPRWAKLESFGAQNVAAVGFPDAMIKDNVADTLAVEGRVLGGTGLKAQAAGDGTITLRLLQEDAAGIEQVAWQGMSGAAVFVGPDLVAIIKDAWSEKPYAALKVLPVERLFRRSEVGEASREAGLQLPLERAREARHPSPAYDFAAAIAANTQGFIGRDWLFDRLDRFRAEHPSGYFSIEADAGLGKTALASSIAERHAAPVFFFSATEGRVRLEACLKHFAAELDDRLGRETEPAPDRAAQDWGYVGELLQLLATTQAEPFLLVIDALDEAEPIPFGNTLLLPKHLPEGVHIVLTSRTPPSLFREAGTALCRLALIHTDAAHRGDVRAFLAARVPDRQLRAALEQASEGNFMYLSYVLTDLEQSQLDPLRPGALPVGLTGYYERFWEGIQAVKKEEGWADWNALYRPTVAMLAAVLEPVSAAWVGAVLGRPAEEIEERALQRWRRFLARSGGDDARWRIVHRSFADFLVASGRVDLPAAHRRISEHLLQGWGGLDAGLPDLPLPGRYTAADEYGLRHLAQHLRHAGDTARLGTLVRVRRWQAARIAQDPSGDLYQTDWQHYWSAICSSNLSAAQTGASVDVAGELDCALTVASINAISSHFGAELLKSFVDIGFWSPATALAAARLNPDTAEGARSIAEIAPSLDATAIETALAIVARPFQSDAPLGAVLHRLCVLGQPDRALAIATAGDRPSAIAALADCLPERLLEEAMRHLREQVAQAPTDIISPDPTIDAWVALLHHAPPSILRTEQVCKIYPRGENDIPAAIARRWAALGEWDAAKTSLGAIPSEAFRGTVLAELAAHAPEPERRAVTETALELVGTNRHPARPAEVLQAIIRFLDPDRAVALLQNCLPKKPILFGETAIVALAAVLPASLMRQARESIRAIDLDSPGWPCGALAIRLAELGHIDDALAMARGAGDSYEVGTAMSALLPRLAALGHQTLAANLATEMHNYGRAHFVPTLLADVSRHVSKRELPTLQAYASTIASDADRKRTLNGLAVGYAVNDLPNEALSLASLIDDRDDQLAFQTQIAICWGDHLGLGLADNALRQVFMLPSPGLQFRALEALAPSLPLSAAADAIEHLLQSAEPDDTSFALRDAWRALLAQLCASGEVEWAWSLAIRAPGRNRHQFRAQVAACCPEPLCTARLRPILDAVLGDQDDHPFHLELFSVIDFLSAELLHELSRTPPDLHRLAANEFACHVAKRLIALGHNQDGIEMAFALDDFWAKVVADGAPWLNAHEIRRCLNALIGFQDPYKAIPSLLRRLAALGEPAEALEILRRLDSIEQQMQALAAVIPELADAELEIAAAWAVESKNKAQSAHAAVAARYAELGRCAPALDLIEDLPYWWDDREKALASIAVCLPQTMLERGLALCKAPVSTIGFLPRLAEQGVGPARRALLLACDLPEPSDRDAAFRRLLPILVQLPWPDLYALWSEAAHILARRPRPEVLRDLGLLLPLYARVGGAPALTSTTVALEQVVARWP